MTTSDAVIRPRWGLFVSLEPTGGSLGSARPRLFSGAPSGLGCAGSNQSLIYVAVYWTWTSSNVEVKVRVEVQVEAIRICRTIFENVYTFLRSGILFQEWIRPKGI